MGAESSNECAGDYLTKSSRLVDFCSSSNSFYGLNSSMSLSSPCTHRCVDYFTDFTSLDHPFVHLDHCNLLNSLFLSIWYPFIYLFRPSLYSLSALSPWLTVCCGTETAPDWRCLSPQGGPDPTSDQESRPQSGAAPAWPHTKCMSSSRKKKENHQLHSSLCIQCD